MGSPEQCNEESTQLATAREKPDQQRRPSTAKNKLINLKKKNRKTQYRTWFVHPTGSKPNTETPRFRAEKKRLHEAAMPAQKRTSQICLQEWEGLRRLMGQSWGLGNLGNVIGEKRMRQSSICAGIAKPRLLRGAHVQKMMALPCRGRER